MQQYSTDIFDKAKEKIYKEIRNPDASEVMDEIYKLIESLDGRGSDEYVNKPFREWSVEELLRAQGRLALLRVTLGVYTGTAMAQANYASRFKIYQNSKEWNPTKTRIEKEYERLNKKVLKGDIESALIEAFWETTEKEVFLQERADQMKSMFDATNQVLTAINRQITEKNQEKADSKYYDQGSGN